VILSTTSNTRMCLTIKHKHLYYYYMIADTQVH